MTPYVFTKLGTEVYFENTKDKQHTERGFLARDLFQSTENI